jgi:hypothetical protein
LPRCDLLHGEPVEIVAGELGLVALFAPGALVAYRLRSHQRARLYVFRTLDVADPLAASVPGVRPRVQLLLDLRSAGRVRRAGALFSHLARDACEPSRLPDAFYVRVGAALAGRLVDRKVLGTLLHAHESRVAAPCNPSSARNDHPRPRRQGKQ